MTSTFSKNYIHFSKTYLNEERTRQECDVIEKISHLTSGATILDIGCGSGRIAIELARRGYRTLGIDNDSSALELAYSAKGKIENCQIQECDFDQFEEYERFDCVISWYTSFGYSTDPKERSLLRKIYAALRPGGMIIIDHINRDASLKKLPKYNVEEYLDDFMIDRFNYKPSTGRLHIERTFIISGKVTRSPYSVRLLTLAELDDWLRFAGFEDIMAFNEFGDEYHLDGRRMIVTGIKK